VARRLVYLITGFLVAATVAFALSWSEARVGFVASAVAEAGAGWWLARRFPARPVSARELRAASIVAPLLGIVVALAIIGVRSSCDCPAKRDRSGESTCHCTQDRPVGLLVGVIAGGIGISLACEVGIRRIEAREAGTRDG
jgi:hypothetical protein